MRSFLLALVVLCASAELQAQQGADETAIRAAITAQAAAWNHADIPAFMQTYEDSPDTTFIGAKLRKGYGPILDRYKQSYSTPEQMGTLTFGDLDVRLLKSSCGKAEFAVVTGTFHLERLDLEQIGFRRQKRADFRGLMRQEYAEDAESCFLASGDSFFELAALEARLLAAPEPVARRRNGELEIWLPPMRGRKYVVAVDPAGGGSDGDYSAAQVVDLESGLQCAEFAGHVGGLELARLVTELAAEYNQAWLVVERNNHGSGVLALAESVCRYARIYASRGQPGWLTNSMSRPAMLGRLDAALVERPECFMSRRLLSECRGFVRLADGRTGARAGLHDDRVMAMAMAMAAREQGLGIRD